jgi:hypothetical protein
VGIKSLCTSSKNILYTIITNGTAFFVREGGTYIKNGYLARRRGGTRVYG